MNYSQYRKRNRMFGFIGLMLLIATLAVGQIDEAYAQTCTTRVTENVIHSPRGPKIQIVEHRTCGYETTTRYYYEDRANGYTNRMRSHGGHRHRSFSYDRRYRGYHRPRYYDYDHSYDLILQSRDFYFRLEGGR